MPEASIILLILSGLCRDESVFTVRHRTERLTRGLVSWFSVHKPDEQEPATTNQTEVSGHIRHSKDTWTFNHTLPRIYVPHGLLLVGPDNEGQCFLCHRATDNLQPGSQAISLLYLLPLPLSFILSDCPCLHVRLQEGIKDSNSLGKIFSTVTSREKLAQCLSLSISFSFLDFTLPFPCHSKQSCTREKG